MFDFPPQAEVISKTPFLTKRGGVFLPCMVLAGLTGSSPMRSSCNYVLMILTILSILLVPDILSVAYAEKKFYSIQVAAFQNLTKAMKLVNDLRKLGRDVFYRFEPTKSRGKWYMVYVDRFGARGEAKKEAEKLRGLGLISDYYIRTLDVEVGDSLNNEREKAKESKPTFQSKQVQEKADVPLIIENIEFELQKGKKEIVFIHSNRYFEPSIFALEGTRPRSVIDIKNATISKKNPLKIPVNGELIEQIRTHFNTNSKTLRVVLDHYPGKNYIVEQIFYEDENIYALEVKEKKPIPNTPGDMNLQSIQLR